MNDGRTAEEVRAKLTRYLSDTTRQEFGPDEDYFELGLVNSMFALELVIFVEKQFELTIESADLDLDHFRTVNRLTTFVLRKSAV